MNRGDARELPIQAHRADEGGAGELVGVDVADFLTPREDHATFISSQD